MNSHCTDTTMHCSSHTNTTMHPDHTAVLHRLRRLQGQIAGLEKMIEERRYCVDILTQFRAVSSALKAAEGSVFEKHLRSCVKSAMESKNKKDTEKKLEEVMDLLLKWGTT